MLLAEGFIPLRLVSNMNIPMLNLIDQYQQINEEINTVIQQVLTSGAYINGPAVRQFEENMEKYLGVKHAIGVASGSDALLLSLHALGIGKGDRVIVPTFTFFATAGAVSRMSGVPVFADIDQKTYNMDLDQVENILEKDRNKEIKAIIPVHLFGLPVDMKRVMDLADKYGLFVIEDACQAINADICSSSPDPDHGNQKAGTIGDTGCFSFFPSKNLGCFGDGGMIVSNDDDLAADIGILRVHGSRPKYYHSVVGYNSRLDTIQAAVLNVKLKYLQEWTDKRRNVAAVYNKAFQAAELLDKVKCPEVLDGHVFHQYVIEVENRNSLIEYLNQKGIGSAIYYPVPLHLQECFKELGYQKGDLPIAENACQRVLALPIDPDLSEDAIAYLVDSIKQFIVSSK